MSYVLINHAPDGTHHHAYKTAAGALKALRAYLTRSLDAGPLEVGQTYYSDWGNALTVEARPAGHTAAKERALFHAYNARECGSATKRQLALLEREGF
jgi:hypothetical protein